MGIITNFGVAIIKYNKKFAIISYNPESIFLMQRGRTGQGSRAEKRRGEQKRGSSRAEQREEVR